MFNHVVLRSLICGLFFASVSLASGLLSAAVLIDDFTDIDDAGTSWTRTQVGVGSISKTDIGLNTSNTIGGQRQTTLALSSVDDVLDEAKTSILITGGGKLSYTSSDFADGSLNLLYDAGGAGNGLNANISTEPSILIRFITFDYASSQNLPVTVTITETAGFGGDSATLTKTLTSAGPQTLAFDLAAFTNIANVNLTSVYSINVFFQAAPGHDFSLDFVEANTVPEPASLAIWGLGALGCAVAGYRRRKVAS